MELKNTNYLTQMNLLLNLAPMTSHRRWTTNPTGHNLKQALAIAGLVLFDLNKPYMSKYGLLFYLF